jgi:para-aminobenzoate synthetase component 1
VWLDVVDEVMCIDLVGTPDDAARMDAMLHALDALWPTLADDELALFLIGHEAACALDERLPRQPRDPTLGPDAWLRRMRIVDVTDVTDDATPPRPFVATPTAHAHSAHVERVTQAREHLLDGVIYQANLAHRLIVEPRTFSEGRALYLEAIRTNAPPFCAFVDDERWGSLISLSPERFVTFDLQAHTASAYPIKGTRPRGMSDVDDARLLAELCASEKDEAEHVMIVDLLRNDLGKLAIAGGVTVEQLMATVSVKNVHHLESTITARLRDDVRASDILRACAPGGSITGAPKSSAVDVIHALEDGPRGPYTGILGAMDNLGRCVSSLLIRTWVRPDEGHGALHVGGGIVVDSDPESEWQETLHKAAAFAR